VAGVRRRIAGAHRHAGPGHDPRHVAVRRPRRRGRCGHRRWVSVGLVGHTVLAALGLGAILRTSERVFVALKLVGAAYLIYLGIGVLRTRQSSMPLTGQGARALGVRLAFERR
jgi:hypothetical protein